MRITHAITRVFLLGVLLAGFGCETFSGPIIVNRSAIPLSITATFSGRVVEMELQPGHHILQRGPQKLEALQVSDGVHRWSFTSIEIERALAEGGGPTHAVVELLGEQIRGIPVSNGKR